MKLRNRRKQDRDNIGHRENALKEGTEEIFMRYTLDDPVRCIFTSRRYPQIAVRATLAAERLQLV